MAPDGIIEAVESMKEQKPVFAVQWHPEWMGDDGLPLFRWLVAEAQLHAKAKEMHRDIKPANFLYTDKSRQRIALADFGIAMTTDSNGSLQTLDQMASQTKPG